MVYGSDSYSKMDEPEAQYGHIGVSPGFPSAGEDT